MLKKRTRDTFEELPPGEILPEPTHTINNTETPKKKINTNICNEKPINNNNNKNTINKLNGYSNNNIVKKDVEFTTVINPNISSDYFTCKDARVGNCKSCSSSRQQQVRECPSCYGSVCSSCAHCCETCSDVICSSCCVIENNNCDCDDCSYSQSHEVDYCIDCNR